MRVKIEKSAVERLSLYTACHVLSFTNRVTDQEQGEILISPKFEIFRCDARHLWYISSPWR